MSVLADVFSHTDVQSRLMRQDEFFNEKKGHLLVFASYTKDRRDAYYPIEGEETDALEEIIGKHAYDIGVRQVRMAKTMMLDLMETDDDYLPYLVIDWGTGESAALFTGGDVTFCGGTSYTTGPIINSWDDLDNLELTPDNRWMEWEIECWRGMMSEYEEGLPGVMHDYRSPLDLANDLRGNQLFTDLYDYPDEVKRLLDMCTDALIRFDKFYRDEIPMLKNLPSGNWGVGVPKPGMIFVNGDPVDLISEEMGEEFNRPYVERVIESAGSMFFHHHSIGVSRARSVSRIKGLTVQSILQDPNGPLLVDCIDDDLIAASLDVPIDFMQRPLNYVTDDFDGTIEKLSQGRFAIKVEAETSQEARQLVEKVRRVNAQCE